MPVNYIGDLDTQIAPWRSGGLLGGGASITISDTEPENPRDGMLWFDWSAPALKIRYDYKTWIELAPTMETPTGPPEVRPPPGPTGPTGPTGPGATVPWANDLTYSFSAVLFQPGDGTGKVPLSSWTNWDPAYAADFTDEALYTGPNRPTTSAELKVRLFATFIGQAEVEVEFDGLTLGTPAANRITIWGHDANDNTITLTGANSTGNPIELRLHKA